MTPNDAKGRSSRIVLLGLGAINRRVAALLQFRQPAAAIVGVITRNRESMQANPIEGAKAIATPAELLALAPDLILEAASREAVGEWGEAALKSARHLVVSSTSAFTDDKLLTTLRATARRFGSQLVLSPGALAGMDALSAASRLGLHEVHHRIVKSPQSWAAASGPRTGAIDPHQSVVLYKGPAREGARLYPLNANVSVVSALSGIGLDRTQLELVSDPTAHSNRHEIHAIGDFGSLAIRLENRPLQANPKSSELAALALVRLVENEVADLVI